MYSRYDPTAHGPFQPIDEEKNEMSKAKEYSSVEPSPDNPHPTDHAESTVQSQKQSGILDSLRGLLGGLRREDSKPVDTGDLLLLAIIALLVLEDGGESDLIIILAIALIIGF